jgi:hypothetical protein
MWTEDIPTEPGFYWFYGEPFMGEMGGHYDGTILPNNKLFIIKIHKNPSGLIAWTDGAFISLRKWDGKKRGVLGKWMPLPTPQLPL